MSVWYLIFAFLLVVGGFIGFKKAGSKASLTAGSISGLLVLSGVYIQSPLLIFIVSFLLVGSFGMRLKKTKKFMPAGMLLILSVITALLSLLELIAA